MPAKDEYITVAEAVERFNRKKSWWYDRINDGDLTAYEVGGDKITRLSVREIEDLLNNPRPKGQPRPRTHIDDAG
jgi:hypothetical protein